jgi:hypothetical protein
MFGAKINRQPGPLNEEALQMLRDKDLKKFSKVMASDGQELGKAVHLRLRPDDADVDLKLYAAYLDVSSLELGTRFYVPTEFIKEYDAEEETVLLSVPFSVVMEENWDREPTFIALKKDEKEDLAE